mmetsp:Transcript_120183/g.347304  ORF Transcript_120183/g.347304 Transcript_120183/m.347304 type:complete len:143 (-) Transcript_120183:143-571(-)
MECRVSPGGFEVVYGLTDVADKLLLTEIASINEHYLWFHCESCPGNHVVLRGVPSRVGKKDIEFAARIAARQSTFWLGGGRKFNDTARVVFCETGHVHKTKSSYSFSGPMYSVDVAHSVPRPVDRRQAGPWNEPKLRRWTVP